MSELVQNRFHTPEDFSESALLAYQVLVFNSFHGSNMSIHGYNKTIGWVPRKSEVKSLFVSNEFYRERLCSRGLEKFPCLKSKFLLFNSLKYYSLVT